MNPAAAPDLSKLPPPADTPAPPSCGWITDPMHLTRQELIELCAAAGVAPDGSTGVDLSKVDHVALPGLVAVAYARRYDPAAYPWTAADRIPLSDLGMGADKDDQAAADQAAEDAYAEECTEAALAGEPAPLPPF